MDAFEAAGAAPVVRKLGSARGPVGEAGVRPRARGLVALIVLAAALCVASARAAEALVTIDGGATVEGNTYEWEVTNHHDSPIIGIEFDHHKADMFTPPNRQWHTDLTIPGGPGEVTASVENERFGIPPHKSAKIELRVPYVDQISSGQGTMLFRFADGTETTATANMPVKPSGGDQWGPLLGLSVIFLVLLAYEARRRRTAKASPADTGDAPSLPDAPGDSPVDD